VFILEDLPEPVTSEATKDSIPNHLCLVKREIVKIIADGGRNVSEPVDINGVQCHNRGSEVSD